jgi:hypothetical protein
MDSNLRLVPPADGSVHRDVKTSGRQVKDEASTEGDIVPNRKFESVSLQRGVRRKPEG